MAARCLHGTSQSGQRAAQVSSPSVEETAARRAGEHVLDSVGHVAGEQPGAEQRLPGEFAPRSGPTPRLGERPAGDPHQVRAWPATLHRGGDRARARSPARAPGPAGRSCGRGCSRVAEREGLQHGEEPSRPPGLSDRAAAAARLSPPSTRRGGRDGGKRPVDVTRRSLHHRRAPGRTARAARARGQLGEPVLAVADDSRGQPRLYLGSSRRSSPPRCRRRRTCGPGRCGAGRSGTPGRWPGPRRRGSTSGRVDDVVGGGERSPVPPALSESRKSGGPVARLEPRDHRVAARLGDAAVQERDSRAEPRGQVRRAACAPNSANWVKQQGLLARGQDLVEDLLQPDQLAGAPADRRAVVQQLGRVVAHLLELGHRGQHQCRGVRCPRVSRSSPSCRRRPPVERACSGVRWQSYLHLDLVGQVVDDRRVGLDPPQHERPGDRRSRAAASSSPC